MTVQVEREDASVATFVVVGNREAAERLYLSPHTVSMHLRHVFTKLGITSRVELTRLYTSGARQPERV